MKVAVIKTTRIDFKKLRRISLRNLKDRLMSIGTSSKNRLKRICLSLIVRTLIKSIMLKMMGKHRCNSIKEKDLKNP